MGKEEDNKGQDGEPEEECGFCIFMKGGGCKDVFTNWSDCVDKFREGEKDFTEECKEQTIALQECMIEHKDYYKDFITPGAGETSSESSSQNNSETKDKDDSKTSDKNPESSKEGQDNKKQQKKDEGGENSKSSKDSSSGQEEKSKESGSKKPEKENKEKDKSENKEGEKKTEEGGKNEGGKSEGKDEKQDNKDTGNKAGKDSETKENSDKKEEDKSSDDQKDDGSDKNQDELKGKTTSKSGTDDVSGTPAEKHAKSSTETSNKQERVIDQESHPVKAKPDEGKKKEAKEKTPEAEQSKSESSEKDDDNKDKGDEEEEEEEEEEKKPEIKIQTAPLDIRFVTTNQARHCYTRYQEYHKCAKEKGDDAEECSFFQRAYRAICPGDWIDKWNEQREEGTFVGKY